MIGERVNNYEIVKLIGEGGMGAVYEAEHLMIRRKVAIKVLRKQLSFDVALVERFFNEARAANEIRHPNIVEVVDVGLFPNGVPYLIMELLEGESLASRLVRVGHFQVAQSLSLILQAAHALVAAHARGIIHRDLKPDNLFLTRDAREPGREWVKILDFGIAKLGADLSTNPVDTKCGVVIGTPAYMSPEQCRGIPDAVDARTDIYSLGIILYEMLCGEVPFLASTPGDLMVMHLTVPPELPSVLRPDLPKSVENIILKSLAKRVEDRYSSMVEFVEALTSVISTPLVIGTLPDPKEPPIAPFPTPASGSSSPGRPTIQNARSPKNGTSSPPTALDPAFAPEPKRYGRAGFLLGGLTLIAGLSFLQFRQTKPNPLFIATLNQALPPLEPPPFVVGVEPIQQRIEPAQSPIRAGVQHKGELLTKKRESLRRSQTAQAIGTAVRPADRSPSPSQTSVPPPLTPAPELSQPGYLSLDSMPWSEVYIGSKLLGTTPLVRVPLPPGKHTLTLRNPELGTSTTYILQIQTGKAVSRFVGWEKE